MASNPLSIDDKKIKKMSTAELAEVFNRQSKLVKNKKMLAKLPDKGKQLMENLAKIDKEYKLHKEIDKLEEALEKMSLATPDVVPDALKDKHVQYLVHLENVKPPEKYKPYATTINPGSFALRPAKLVPLASSIMLQIEQNDRANAPDMQAAGEGTSKDNVNGEYPEEVLDEAASSDDEGRLSS